MKFDNSFEVSLPPSEAWTVLMDVERIAPCMPGATLTEVIDDRSFKGTVSVRLGPVALTFEGEARFEHIDEAGQTANVKAQGKDPKGRGGADATVTFRLEPSETGSKVLIETDLTLSGSVAQYGRGVGMIQSVASQLIGQFAKALEEEIAQDKAAEPATEESPVAPTAPSTPPPAEPQAISGFSLFFAALGNWLKGLFGK
ncbi:MAG: carbon monoxide dehydrogenase [Rhodospirillaceae bacterium]|nr:carbon monoxide dehydrogenase [Rhodospirillaceae bacterium]|tara:strand:- start:134 stop:733 length:600 start_codon:yes stop_codon:yes gene_type:complete